ncbi:hypothetical protein DKK66_20115 (plasmid) [Aquitalea sp. USM4]|nr:hypothetical protein DKK66_20115 [Aquitalea sp. USM4]
MYSVKVKGIHAVKGHAVPVEYAAGWDAALDAVQAARAQPANIQDGYSWALDLPGKPSIDGLHAIVSEQPADASEPAGAKVYAIDTIRTRADHLAKCAWQLLNACISIKIARNRYDDRKTATAAMELNAQEEVFAEYTHAVRMAIYEYHKRVQREIDLRFRQPAQPAGEAVACAAALEDCDWSGVPIGNKAVIAKAISLLRTAPPAQLAPVAGEAVAHPLDNDDAAIRLAIEIGAYDCIHSPNGKPELRTWSGDNSAQARQMTRLAIVKAAVADGKYTAPPAQVQDAEWIAKLRHELLFAPMKSNFTMTRDELIQLLGGVSALAAAPQPTQQPAQVPDGWCATIDPECFSAQDRKMTVVSGYMAGQAYNEICKLLVGNWPDARLQENAPFAHKFFMELFGAAAPQPKGGE